MITGYKDKHEYISPFGVKSTVYLMDCMEFLAQCKPKSFGLAVVDTPYGISINNSGRVGHYGGKGKKWDNEIPSDLYFQTLFEVSNNQVIWGGNYFYLPPCKCFLIWDKRQPQGVSFAMSEFAWTNFDSSAKTFYLRPQGQENRQHPTQKPIALYDWIYANYAKPTDTILDTHLGSGSSRIAADKAKLGFVGVELDSDYFYASVKRFEQYAAQLKLF